jgi:hypothetical protein
LDVAEPYSTCRWDRRRHNSTESIRVV